MDNKGLWSWFEASFGVLPGSPMEGLWGGLAVFRVPYRKGRGWGVLNMEEAGWGVGAGDFLQLCRKLCRAALGYRDSSDIWTAQIQGQLWDIGCTSCL